MPNPRAAVQRPIGFGLAFAAVDGHTSPENPLAAGFTMAKKVPDPNKLDRIVAEAQQQREQRERGYRERALKMYPWVCGRCGREFTRDNVQMLTVHHRDHNHDNNPPDGSNWELLCLYCHDNEHARYLDSSSPATPSATGGTSNSTFKAFADLAQRLKQK